MAQQTIVAHFDNRSDAQQAVDALVQAGISQTSITLLPENEAAYQQTNTASYDHGRDEGGFWTSLGNLMLPDEDRYAYAEGMSRGGVTLSVMTDDAQLEQVADIIERYGAVDMDEREASWKREGWTGYTGSSAAVSGASTAAASSSAARPALDATSTEDGTIELVEEQLRVGKRQSSKGRLRLRTYVIERPVEEQVNLRSERVTIKRRPVDREVAPGEAAFQERTIEAEERFEEAVVSKTARVKEEIALHKDVEIHTETIHDTVRSTEAEIEDDRAGRGPADNTDPLLPRDPDKI
ncbi:YsnF/AvaK domain-containing protein [Geminicoccus harenae]|uniref:YsnF/AvaK domain-containing protein n=1 Tax=Geminicoccus harenae TaxID=2498453 RepID=UPI00168A9DFB|nr:YsnF/AvaK domain-containing protein [Geminicoccus harenae]